MLAKRGVFVKEILDYYYTWTPKTLLAFSSIAFSTVSTGKPFISAIFFTTSTTIHGSHIRPLKGVGAAKGASVSPIIDSIGKNFITSSYSSENVIGPSKDIVPPI